MTTPDMHELGTPDFRAINLACGGKLCHSPGWINADHAPSSPLVVKIDLSKPLPYADHCFDVVYHSQFIEHLEYPAGVKFLQECNRILKPGGILRVVTPDLEDQAREYLKQLEIVRENQAKDASLLQYEWIRLEMLDQLVRHSSGGEMTRFLDTEYENVKPYLLKRLGRSGINMSGHKESHETSIILILKKLIRFITGYLKNLIPDQWQVGKFRLSGEAHLYMYDDYMLKKTLEISGFSGIKKVSALESSIYDWNDTLLDCDEENSPDCPASLFMEATKPASSAAQVP